MTPDEVRHIIRQELSSLLKSDRYVFERLLQIADGRNIQLGTATGTMIGTATTQKLGFFGKTPITRHQQPTDISEVINLLVAYGLSA